MAPPNIRDNYDISSSLEQLQTLVASIDTSTKVPSAPRQKSPVPKPGDAAITGKRVRVQAFQQVHEATTALKLQRTMASFRPAATTAPPCVAEATGGSDRSPMMNSNTHNANKCSQTMESTSDQSILHTMDGHRKDCLTRSETAERQHRLDMERGSQAHNNKPDAVCQWVCKLSVSNPKTVEILCFRDVLCFSKDMLSQDLPSCNDLHSITRFDTTDLEAFGWE